MQAVAERTIDQDREKGLGMAFVTAKKNLVNYRHCLLQSGEGEVASAPFHYKWSDDLLNGTKNKAIEGFRESAKTQYVLRSFPLYCLSFPSKARDYIVIIKNNATLASNKLKEIEREYETNPLARGGLVEIHEQSGQALSVDIKDENGDIINVRIEAYGKGASVRGLSNLDRRPKIVIIDDPQDVEDARSETVCQSDWDWFLSDVVFLGKFSRIFMIGNNLGEKCIIERVFNDAENLGFDVERVPIETDGVPTWPEMYAIENIIAEKQSYANMGKIDIWMRERMCIALSKETQVFDEDDYRYFSINDTDHVAKDCRITATLDPAASTNIESCFRAIVVNAVSQDDYWNIVDVPYGRWDSIELIDQIFDTVVKWKLREFYIEKGMLKDFLEPFLLKEMPKRKIYFNLEPIEHAKMGSKLERIKMLQPRFKAHTIWFPREAQWLSEMRSELAGVTKDLIKSLYIDLVDALAMQEQCTKMPFKHNFNKTRQKLGVV